MSAETPVKEFVKQVKEKVGKDVLVGVVITKEEVPFFFSFQKTLFFFLNIFFSFPPFLLFFTGRRAD